MRHKRRFPLFSNHFLWRDSYGNGIGPLRVSRQNIDRLELASCSFLRTKVQVVPTCIDFIMIYDWIRSIFYFTKESWAKTQKRVFTAHILSCLLLQKCQFQALSKMDVSRTQCSDLAKDDLGMY
jgi:hypothetical protein